MKYMCSKLIYFWRYFFVKLVNSVNNNESSVILLIQGQTNAWTYTSDGVAGLFKKLFLTKIFTCPLLDPL